MRKSISLFAVLALVLTPALAQVKSVTQYIEQVQALSRRASVKAADDYIESIASIS